MKTITPHQYQAIENEQRAIIEAAEKVISKAYDQAHKSKPPKNDLRKATAKDLATIGMIVWHDNGDDGWFWNTVCEPNHYGDDFKAYIGDDGCRYGLDGAWVYKSTPAKEGE